MSLEQIKMSADQLLKVVKRMPNNERADFIDRVQKLRPKHRARRLSHEESKLMMQINQTLSQEEQKRFDKLNARRRAEKLTKQEYNELMALNDKVEFFNVNRLEALLELAKIRKTTVSALMDELQLRPKARHLPHEEFRLLMKINEGLPPQLQKQYDKLYAKLSNETITKKEHEELLKIIEEVERRNAERAECLVKLAQLRNQTVDALLKDLETNPSVK